MTINEEFTLDFSNGYWRTNKDHHIYIKNWIPSKKLWSAYLLDDEGTVLVKCYFDREGKNSQYGDLICRKRGAQSEGWPSVKEIPEAWENSA